MSQRSEKLHRQVAQLRADVDALQVAWLSQQHCDAVELAAAAERTRQAHRRASEAQRTARAWKLNAILTLILAALIAGVALVISAKATTTEPATPSAVISPLDNGRLPGDDTPAKEPLRLDQAHATDVPGWEAKTALGFEEAQIALRTRFQETPDTLYAMKLVSDISLGAKVIYNDMPLC